MTTTGRTLRKTVAHCPHCLSKRLVKAGMSRGWNGYEKQRYQCKACYRHTVTPVAVVEGK